MIFLWPTSPAEMGISKGTLYYHYPTKDDLDHGHHGKAFGRTFRKDYVDWLDRHQNDGISFSASSMSFSIKGVKLFNKSKMHIYLINECMRGNESLRKQYTELWKEWQDKLEEGLESSFPIRKTARPTPIS
jgi:hypothetical protein